MKEFEGVVRRFATAPRIKKRKDEDDSKGHTRGKGDRGKTSENISTMRVKGDDGSNRVIKPMISGKPYKGGATGKGRCGRNEKLRWFLEKGQEEPSFEKREVIGWVSKGVVVGGLDGRGTIDMHKGVVPAERIGEIDGIIWKSAKNGDSERSRSNREASVGVNANAIGGDITVVGGVVSEEGRHRRTRNRNRKKLFTVV